MDITILVSTALGTILPFLVKGGEEIAKSAAADLWEVIKKPFTSKKDQETLQRFQNNPTDPEQVSQVESKLKDFIATDRDLFMSLEEALDKMPEESKKTYQQVIQKGGIGFQDTSGGTFNFDIK